jgi:hypothetical protein
VRVAPFCSSLAPSGPGSAGMLSNKMNFYFNILFI